MARPNSGAILKDLRENLGTKFHKKTIKEEAIIQESQKLAAEQKTQSEKITRAMSALLGSDEDVATIIITSEIGGGEAVSEIESKKFANKRFFVFADYSGGRVISSVVDFDNAKIYFSEPLSDAQAHTKYHQLLEALERKRTASDFEVVQQITELEHVTPSTKAKPELQASNRERNARYLARIKADLEKQELIGKFTLQQIPQETLLRPNQSGDLNEVIALLNACIEVYRLKALGQEEEIQKIYLKKAKNIARYFFGNDKIGGENFLELAKTTQQQYEELMSSDKKDEVISDADDKLKILMAINNLYKEKKKLTFNDAELEKIETIKSNEVIAEEQGRATLEFYTTKKQADARSRDEDFYFQEIGFTNYGDLVSFLENEFSKTYFSEEEIVRNHKLVNFLFPIKTDKSLPTLDQLTPSASVNLFSSDSLPLFSQRFIQSCNFVLECHGLETKEPDEYGVRIDYIPGVRLLKKDWIEKFDPDLKMLIRMLQSCLSLDFPESQEMAKNLYTFLQEEIDGKYGSIEISDESREMLDNESDIGIAVSHLGCEPIMTPQEFAEQKSMTPDDTESEEEQEEERDYEVERLLYAAKSVGAAVSQIASAAASRAGSASASASAMDFSRPMAPPPDPRSFLSLSKRPKLERQEAMLAIMPAPNQSDAPQRPQTDPTPKRDASGKLTQDLKIDLSKK